MSTPDKKERPNLLNDKGELDFAKLLETNPDLLASFIHPRQEDEEGGSESGGIQSVSMSFAVGTAALRDAQGLSMSYAPLNSAEQIQTMSISAQSNLGLAVAQGLSMDLGHGSSSNPFGNSDDAHATKKDKKTYRKKVQGS